MKKKLDHVAPSDISLSNHNVNVFFNRVDCDKILAVFNGILWQLKSSVPNIEYKYRRKIWVMSYLSSRRKTRYNHRAYLRERRVIILLIPVRATNAAWSQSSLFPFSAFRWSVKNSRGSLSLAWRARVHGVRPSRDVETRDPFKVSPCNYRAGFYAAQSVPSHGLLRRTCEQCGVRLRQAES